MNEKATKQIVSEIFGENGLIEADTTVDFTKLVTNIESKYEASVGAYLTDKIIPTIREYVYSTWVIFKKMKTLCDIEGEISNWTN